MKLNNSYSDNPVDSDGVKSLIDGDTVRNIIRDASEASKSLYPELYENEWTFCNYDSEYLYFVLTKKLIKKTIKVFEQNKKAWINRFAIDFALNGYGFSSDSPEKRVDSIFPDNTKTEGNNIISYGRRVDWNETTDYFYSDFAYVFREPVMFVLSHFYVNLKNEEFPFFVEASDCVYEAIPDYAIEKAITKARKITLCNYVDVATKYRRKYDKVFDLEF